MEIRLATALDTPVFVVNSTLGNIGGSLRTIPDDFDDVPSEGEQRTNNNGDRFLEAQEGSTVFTNQGLSVMAEAG